MQAESVDFAKGQWNGYEPKRQSTEHRGRANAEKSAARFEDPNYNSHAEQHPDDSQAVKLVKAAGRFERSFKYADRKIQRLRNPNQKKQACKRVVVNFFHRKKVPHVPVKPKSQA